MSERPAGFSTWTEIFPSQFPWEREWNTEELRAWRASVSSARKEKASPKEPKEPKAPKEAKPSKAWAAKEKSQ